MINFQFSIWNLNYFIITNKNGQIVDECWLFEQDKLPREKQKIAMDWKHSAALEPLSAFGALGVRFIYCSPE